MRSGEMIQKEINYRLYWDGYGLDKPGSGIFRYAQEIYEEVIIQGIYPTILYQKRSEKSISEHNSIILKDRISPILPDFFYNSKLIWPFRVSEYLSNCPPKDDKIIIYHGLSNFNVPFDDEIFKKKIKTVLTIHDLIPLLDRTTVSTAYYLQLRYLLPKILPKVSKIICVSEWTKNIIKEKYKGIENKIFVIPNGFGAYQRQELVQEKMKEKDEIKILYVSRYEKYKGFDILMNIVREAKGKIRLTMITCKKGTNYINNQYKDLVVKEYVKTRTNISDQELKIEYVNSDVYVHPSKYEGFGLPISEAMILGMPVVYQSGSAVDEVAGKEVAFPVPRMTPISEWIDIIFNAYLVSRRVDFQGKMKKYIDSKNKWSETGKRVLEIYDSLC